jgi:hypothetical protein
LPADLRDPIVQKMDLAGQPVLAYTIRSAQMDDEALSWFVDNDISRKLLAVKGVGAVNRVGGVSAKSAWRWTRRSCRHSAPPPPTFRASCARCRWKARAAAPTWARASNPCARWAPSRPRRKLPRWSSLMDGRRIRLDQVATVTDTVAEQRAAALLNGKPVVGFRSARAAAVKAKWPTAAPCVALEKLKAEPPTSN